MTRYAAPELLGLILDVLAEGPVESRAGYATALLVDYTGMHAAGAHGTTLVRLGLRQLERAGRIERDVRGGRTYRIALKSAAPTAED